MRHFSRLWNLLCGLHNEIILVGASMVTTEQNSDPTKYNGLSSTICKGGHYITPSWELCSKRIYATTMWKGGHYVYTIPYREPSFVQSKNLCHLVQFCASCNSLFPLLLTFVFYGLKKLHVLLFLVELKPRTWRK